MDTGPTTQLYRFDRFCLDRLRGMLLDETGEAVALRPKTFALLCHFAENAGRVIDRGEIMDAIWPNVVVTDDSIAQCVKEIRRALRDDDMRILRTLPRRGFLFAAQVTRQRRDEAPGAVGVERVPQPGGPVLAVLPLTNLTGDPDQEYFADGITEDLTTTLSHTHWFSVVSRNSAFLFKGRTDNPRQAGRDLGANFLLTGSVRKAGAQLRITVHLTEVATGRQVWAERFDGDLSDIFGLQDRISIAVSGAIGPSMRLADMQRSLAKPTESLTAYDLYLRGMARRYAGRAGSDEARALLRRAIELDPGFTGARATLAALHGARLAEGWADQTDLAEAVQNARAILERADTDPTALALAGHTLAIFERDFETGLGATERAVSLAPNSPPALFCAGRLRVYVSDPDGGIPLLERWLVLGPLDPSMFYVQTGLCLAHLTAGRPSEATAWAQRALRGRMNFPSARRLLAASLWHEGRHAEAAAVVRELLSLSPGLTVAQAAKQTPLRDRETLDIILKALRAAGLPD